MGSVGAEREGCWTEEGAGEGQHAVGVEYDFVVEAEQSSARALLLARR